MKSREESVFVCSNCGNEFSKWAGQCAGCGEWNSLKQVPDYKSHITNKSQVRSRKLQTGRIEAKNLGNGDKSVEGIESVFSSNIPELDRVLGKGIVRGGVTLFAGEPGIGKSTLLTQLLGKVSGLYVAGEESAEQIGLRVDRLKIERKYMEVLETNLVEVVEDYMERTNNVYKIMVVDSIQTMTVGSTVTGTGSIGAFGSVNQIREATFRLIELAKRKRVAIFIVGHVTKEGEIAGPKLLEHMVDTVLYFEGDKNSDLRLLRVTKNRFGPTDEVGVFLMGEGGLRGVSSEEINLVGEGGEQAKVGSALTVVVEGTRPMLVEIQALVTESFAPMPKRIFSGVDYNRGQLLVAVAQKVLGIPLYKYDVYVAVSGGMKITETGADLAIVAAMWSSYKEKPLLGKKAWVGEVSLLGEVKKVRQMEKRMKEVKAAGREMENIYSIRELKNQG